MSEEIKKEMQDAELNPEKLDKVSGGYIIHNDDTFKLFCSKCGAEMTQKDREYVCPNGCK